jgi:hypothetical protein
MKVKISFKIPYFHKRVFDYHLHLELGYISMLQVNIHCVGNHFATFRCALGFFEILDIFMVVISQVRNIFG